MIFQKHDKNKTGDWSRIDIIYDVYVDYNKSGIARPKNFIGFIYYYKFAEEFVFQPYHHSTGAIQELEKYVPNLLDGSEFLRACEINKITEKLKEMNINKENYNVAYTLEELLK